MNRKTNNLHVGSSLEELLREQGTFEETQAHAVKAVLAWQLRQAMDKGAVTKSEMARRMGTSRAHLDRLLDPRTTAFSSTPCLRPRRPWGVNCAWNWYETMALMPHSKSRSSPTPRQNHSRLSPLLSSQPESTGEAEDELLKNSIGYHFVAAKRLRLT